MHVSIVSIVLAVALVILMVRCNVKSRFRMLCRRFANIGEVPFNGGCRYVFAFKIPSPTFPTANPVVASVHLRVYKEACSVVPPFRQGISQHLHGGNACWQMRACALDMSHTMWRLGAYLARHGCGRLCGQIHPPDTMSRIGWVHPVSSFAGQSSHEPEPFCRGPTWLTSQH